MNDAASIIVTDADFERLQSVLDQNDTPVSESLEAELQRATSCGRARCRTMSSR